jgi:hypothetical protein
MGIYVRMRGAARKIARRRRKNIIMTGFYACLQKGSDPDMSNHPSMDGALRKAAEKSCMPISSTAFGAPSVMDL